MFNTFPTFRFSNFIYTKLCIISIVMGTLLSPLSVVSAQDATSSPIAHADQASVNVNKPTAIAVLKNDNGEKLSISNTSAFSQEGAKLVINQSKTKIIYTPRSNFGGNDSFWYEVTDQYQQKTTTTVNVTVSTSLAARGDNLDFLLVPIHYDALNDEPHTWQENEGLTSFTLAHDANVGDQSITLSGNTNLHDSELIVYLSKSGHYIVTQVASRNGNTINLTEALNEPIAQGNNIWNFYHDAAHPNVVGYKALADFSIGKLDTNILRNKSHAFIGDSWLDDGIFENRIKHILNPSQTINKAVGGRRSEDTLNVFDADFPSSSAAPDYFWVILGTNDYWGDISPDAYIENMTNLIKKINNLGATAIVLDSSVGPIIYDDTINSTTSIRKDLSDAYASRLAQLFEQSASGNTTPPSNTGSTDTGSTDTGSTDTGSTDTGSTDTGSSNTESSETGSTDTSSSNTESSETNSNSNTDTGNPTSNVIPSRSGGGSILFLELFLLTGLWARRQRKL